MELPSVQLPQLPHESPAVAARLTRSALGLSPEKPISNVVNALETNGVLVLGLPIILPKRDAFSAWIESARIPLVALPIGSPGDRLRFSTAHEVGHLVTTPIVTGRVKSLEAQADMFAAEFLLPAEAIAAELPTPFSLSRLPPLKKRWGVSLQALILRAFQVGAISMRRKQQLFKQLASEGYLRQEPVQIPVEKPRVLRKMAEVLYGSPPDVKRLADDFALPPNLASAILGVHAQRTEVVSSVSVSGRFESSEANDEDVSNIVALRSGNM
jgi:Zn-dependent peptidase ImmA (M78 family)